MSADYPDFWLRLPKGGPVAQGRLLDERATLRSRRFLVLAEGHLVYAKGNAPHGSHRVRHAGVVIHQHALDLDQPPAGLLDGIHRLAQRLTSVP